MSNILNKIILNIILVEFNCPRRVAICTRVCCISCLKRVYFKCKTHVFYNEKMYITKNIPQVI